MKTLQKITLVVALITIFSSCQTGTDINQVLSKPETRKAIMDSIANNSSMSQEMLETMMNNKSGKMMIQGNEKMIGMMMENYGAMKKMLKENPTMMQSMMTEMIEASKGDSSVMSSMLKTMMGNEQMMGMIGNMMGGNKDMQKMDGMNKMEGMDHNKDKK